MNRAVGPLAMSALLFAAAPAAAQRDEARLRFEEGVRLFERDRYEEALVEFEASLRLRETAGVVYNVAGTYRALGRSAQALGAYERFVALRGDGMSRRERAEVDAALRDLRGRVALLTVVVDPPHAEVRVNGQLVTRWPVPVDLGGEIAVEGRADRHVIAERRIRPTASGPAEVRLHLDPMTAPTSLRVRSNVTGAIVRVDGRVLGETPLRADVAAGSHEVRVEAEGHTAEELTVEVREGEEVARDVTLVPLGAPPGRARAREPEGPGIDLVPWAIGGASAVALGVGGWFLYQALQPEPLQGDREVTLP